MKKIRLTLAMLATAGSLATAPAFADHNNHRKPFFNKENVGRIVGTGLGALLGSKIGDGRGNDAAIAAGAVGGYVLGGKVGRDWRPKHRSYSSHHSTHGGHRPHYSQHKKHHRKHHRKHKRSGYLQPVQYMPELDHIDAPFRATRTSNVRGGPSKKYAVVDGLRRGERVRVLGRVIDSNWYLVAQGGIIQGFVHSSLLRPAKRRHGGRHVRNDASHHQGNNNNYGYNQYDNQNNAQYNDGHNGHYLPSPLYK